MEIDFIVGRVDFVVACDNEFVVVFVVVFVDAFVVLFIVICLFVVVFVDAFVVVFDIVCLFFVVGLVKGLFVVVNEKECVGDVFDEEVGGFVFRDIESV